MSASILAGSAIAIAIALAGQVLAGVVPAGPAGVAASAPRRSRPVLPSAAITGIAAMIGGGVGMALAGPIGVVILGVAGAAIPSFVRRRRATKTSSVVERQLLDLVSALAASLRAGASLEQALSAAGSEVPSPIGPSVARVVDRAALGTPLDASVETWAEEIDTSEARLIAGVLALHRRTGGALAGPLDELARTLRSRSTAARELRSLTAQARLSAAILGLLPIGFLLFLSTVSRRDIEAAVSTPAGAIAVAIGLALQGAAFVWIRSLLRAGER